MVTRNAHGEERLALRWTVGDASARAFEALRLSIRGAWNLFGPKAEYVVCVHTIAPAEAADRMGEVPPGVRWQAVTRDLVPDFLRARLDGEMAEGLAWKFAPVRLFPDRFELALDNDCILWALPDGVARWLADGRRCLIAEDVRASFGRFADLCGPEPRNSGIRGLPPDFDYEASLRALLEARPDDSIDSELDEQGLQVAAASRPEAPFVVRSHEVTICSPFPPHLPNLGRCGAHFVGLNAPHLPWALAGRPAEEWIAEHFDRLRPALYARLGLPAQGALARTQ
jgi:hypothetical protein